MSGNPRLFLLPKGPYIEIDGGALYLGRDCHLAASIPDLSNKVVSSRHCRIVSGLQGAWVLEDLNSSNGTWLYGKRVTKPTALRADDVFSLGKAGPRFKVELPTLIIEEKPATLLESDSGPAATLLENPDGSAERPFRAGKTPRVTLRHLRTGEEFSAEGYTVVIGRDPKAAQIVIRSDDQKHVSSRHAEIQFRVVGVAVLRDLGSRNGTWLNGKKVTDDVPLEAGASLVLGAEATTLRVIGLEM